MHLERIDATDSIDQAVQVDELLKSLALKKRAEVKRIEESKVKLIIDGKVLCEECLNEIPEERIKALPFTTICVDCKSIQERIDR